MRAEIERFEEKFVEDDETGCHLWTASLTKKGYGNFQSSVGTLAHRFAMATKERLDASLVIDHLCRNRACVNPEHLEQVPSAENTARGDHSGNGQHQRDKTHCPQGHEYSGSNLFHNSKGARRCRTCSRKSYAK